MIATAVLLPTAFAPPASAYAMIATLVLPPTAFAPPAAVKELMALMSESLKALAALLSSLPPSAYFTPLES